MNTVSGIIHGESGAGKTWLLETMPGPRLIADTEGRTKYLRNTPKVEWDPRTQDPNSLAIEANTTIIAKVRSYPELDMVVQWLTSGKHPFRSFGLDSATESQKRKKDNITGENQMQLQNWGELLRAIEKLARGIRDLTDHPTNPLACALMVAGTHEKNGQLRPMLEGAISLNIPYYVDLNGYLYTVLDPETGTLRRALQIQPFNNIVAKDGTDLLTQHYGHTIYSPNFTEILGVLNG